eukprot:5898119-Pyramimonas_sp.AAC.1
MQWAPQGGESQDKAVAEPIAMHCGSVPSAGGPGHVDSGIQREEPDGGTMAMPPASSYQFATVAGPGEELLLKVGRRHNKKARLEKAVREAKCRSHQNDGRGPHIDDPIGRPQGAEEDTRTRSSSGPGRCATGHPTVGET